MTNILKSVGRRVRSSLSRMGGVSEEEFLSHAVDRIDLELSMREFDRHRGTHRTVLGGASRM